MTFDYLLAVLPVLALTYIASGIVKGVTGFGMPFIAVPGAALALGIPITQAMAWVMISAFTTNSVQLIQNVRYWRIIREIWPLLLTMAAFMTASVQLLSVLRSEWLSIFLGVVIVVTISAQMLKKWDVQPDQRRRAYILSGAISGFSGGLTSFYGFPALQVMLASGMKKEEFIFSAGLLLFMGTTILTLGLSTQGLMTKQDGVMSLLLLFPAIIGLLIGQRVRRVLSPAGFSRVVMGVLLATGLSMLIRGVMGLL